jgi:hypothetical protein
VPTYKRPVQLQRLINSLILNTKELEKIELVVAIDNQDESYNCLDCKGLNVVKLFTSIKGMGELNTLCLNNSHGSIVMLGNDDMVIGTKGWDLLLHDVVSKFPDEVFLAYGNDLFKGKRLCTFPILSRRTCNLIGDPFPLEYIRGFIDTHLLDIFNRLKKLGRDRIVYIDSLIVEHLHYRANKSEIDQTYRIGLLNRYRDDSVYLQMSNYRSTIAMQLLSAIGVASDDVSIKHRRPQILPAKKFNSLSFIKYIIADEFLNISEKIKMLIYFFLRDIARLLKL